MFAVWSWGVGGGDIVGICWWCMIVYCCIVMLEDLVRMMSWVQSLRTELSIEKL
jgi:hypothetical protein